MPYANPADAYMNHAGSIECECDLSLGMQHAKDCPMMEAKFGALPKKAAKLFRKAKHKAHRHAVIVYRGSNIVAQGFNHDEVHAEVAALKKLWPSEREGTKVVSLRMTRGGRLGMAKPCRECENFMREAGVKLVLYSNAKGQMERMRL